MQVWNIFHKTNGEKRQESLFWEKKMSMVWERSVKARVTQRMWMGLCSGCKNARTDETGRRQVQNKSECILQLWSL